MFVVPVPLIHENMSGTFAYQALRCLGLIPLVFAIIIFYCWVVVRSLFLELGEGNKPDSADPCCPMRMKTGVQIVGGILAIISGVILVAFFAKLDEIISKRYLSIFET